MRKLIYFLILISIVLNTKIVNAEELVNVKLVQHVGETKRLEFRINGKYNTLNPTLQLKEGVTYVLSLKKGHFYLKGQQSKIKLSEELILIPDHYDYDHQIYINERPYLGAIEFKKEKNRYIRPVNQLSIEDYLKGVIPFEVYPSWGIETLKSQALAARTYTYTHKTKEMDDTIKYQVYGGYTWSEKATKAVEETKGEVITFNHKPIDAFYSASNGGVTENNSHVWGGKPKTYFPIKKDQYDPIHPWTFSLHKTQLNLQEIEWSQDNWWDSLKEKDEIICKTMKQYLQSNGFPGDIKIVSIPYFTLAEKVLESKRSIKGSIEVEFLHRLLDGTVVYEQFSRKDVNLNKIRPLIGGNLFKSYYIDSLIYKDEMYTMKGRGFGHGVGMSQWGANFMGVSGKSYNEIIQYYYPGTTIETVSSSE